jgi:glycosyltransferase involved in cell wall biosynthesis
VKIAIAVQGRFHAFHLARALLERGCDVTVLTNYPKWGAARFGLPVDRIRSFWPHGVLTRVLGRLEARSAWRGSEAWLHAMFGRWTARQLTSERWDVVHPWSGVAEESLRSLNGTRTVCLLMRGSAHIRTQAQLLMEEEERTGVPQDQPSRWRIAREEREYALADGIVVLSTFAYRTFISQGVPAEKLHLIPLGASLQKFRPVPEIVRARQRRLLTGGPLRVLYVGAMSFRKGLRDLARVVKALGTERFAFQFVGPQPLEARAVLAELRADVTLRSKQPEDELPGVYAWGDVFIFPTIEDGFAIVLAQAAAAALPILTTTNCSGPDLLHEGESGWIVPIREPEALAERLRWCNDHRSELARMVGRIHEHFQPRGWAEVASDFDAACRRGVHQRPGAVASLRPRGTADHP